MREEPPAAPSIPVIDLELNGADHSNHSSSTTINDGEIAEFSDEEDDVVVGTQMLRIPKIDFCI